MQNINIDKLLFKYEAALKIIKTKFDIIYNELNQNDKYNYIEYIKSRIKSEQSIYNKLSKNGYEITEDNIENHIHDIAGIRIVCSFLSDIEKVEELVKKAEDIKIIKRKDYITNPKSNGYSSLHLIAKVPVPLLAKVEDVEVEIQIRTIAMDMWASLEHKLFYKAPKYNQISKTNLINDFSVETRRIDNLMENMIKKSEEHNNVANDNYYNEKIEIIKEFNMLKYQLAEKVLKEKAENLSYELSNTKNVNPIEHIKTRIKKPLNIVRKLERLNYDITEENMNNHIHDLVGIRIVCSFLSDLKEIEKIIEQDHNIIIIKEKNYIDNPKPNGYRSYHLNIIIPVQMIGKTEYVEAEVQIRTIAMDMWATLEHKICYQKGGNIPEPIKERLKLISNYINKMDISIDELIKRAEKTNNNKKLELKPKKH